VSTRTRNLQQALDDQKNYRDDLMWFKFKGREYRYTPALHLMTLSNYTQAIAQNADQVIVLVDTMRDENKKPLRTRKRKLKLSSLELQTLLDKCDRTLRRMEIARTKVDEVTE
jgi:hypothetical protein